MIRPLRVRHRRWVTALAVLVPIGFAAAIAGRESEQLPANLPEQLVDDRPVLGPSPRVETDLWGELAIVTRISSSDAGTVLALEPTTALKQPDLLVYWSANAPADGLPEDATLLGTLGERERTFALPSGADGGHLMLYSLARFEVVASATLED